MTAEGRMPPVAGDRKKTARSLKATLNKASKFTVLH